MEDSGPTSDKNWFVLITILLVNGDELNSAKVFSSSFLFFFFFFIGLLALPKINIAT